MEKIITLKNEYNSLDSLNSYLQTESSFEASKDYDIWEQRTNSNGQMEQCIVLKKSSMHAIKMFFTEGNQVKVNHIIPSKLMNAYFGKSVKARKNILEVITGKIMEVALAPAQKKAFEELEQALNKISA